MADWTIQKLLNWTAEHFTKRGIDSPRLSAELLLSYVLGLKRIELYTQFDKPVAKPQLDKLHNLVKRAGDNEPIAYLVGRTEFYSLELDITPDCLIPRPETELLVERAIEFLRTRSGKQFVCDLCTGSGCIAVAIAKNYPDADIIATDICDAALSVAGRNIEKYRLKKRIKLLCGDLFDPVIPQLDVEKPALPVPSEVEGSEAEGPARHSPLPYVVPMDERRRVDDGGFDLIVCNPPYISDVEFEKLDKNVKDYEPKSALYAGTDGLDIYKRICEKAGDFLKNGGALMLEIGYSQGQAVRELLEKTNCFGEITIEKDYHDNDRIVIAKKQSSV